MDEAEAAIDAARDLSITIGWAATWRGDIALLGDPRVAAAPHTPLSLERGARPRRRRDPGHQRQRLCFGVCLLRAGFIEAGMEAAGALAALAAETGHGGFGSWGDSFGFAGTVETARSAPGADAAFERGRRLDPAQRVPRILALAREATTPRVS